MTVSTGVCEATAADEAPEADRLAAFAVGCLGAVSPKAAGTKLGLMGSATLEETIGVLKHLETLALQRAAKLAGCAPGTGSPRPTSADGLCQRFEVALLGAVQTTSVAELFDRLPHDAGGRADLMGIFGLAPAAGTVKERGDGFDFTAEYVERAADLPPAPADGRRAAEAFLLGETVEDDRWEADTSGINALRSAVRTGGEAPAGPELLRAVALRCGSRRPALAKTALRAIVELAEAGPAGGAWADAADGVFAGCLAASRGTKVVARVAEEALAAAVKRHAADASPARAAEALVACTAVAVKAKPSQLPAVALGLKCLHHLAPGLAVPSGWAGGESAQEASAAVRALCEEVLATRSLGAAYGEARAVCKALPPAAGLEASNAS